MKCIVEDNCTTPKTECWSCEDYSLYLPRDKRILSPRQKQRRLERKAKTKEKKTAPASMRARNNRNKGAKGERDLYNLFQIENLPIKRVMGSGKGKAFGGDLIGGTDNYASDMILEVNDTKYRIEVKVGHQIPAFIGEKQAEGIEGFCRLFNFPQLLAFFHFGLENLFEPNLIPDVRKKKLHDFFNQDNCAIVAMSPHGTTNWYFAVKNEYLDKIGGSC